MSSCLRCTEPENGPLFCSVSCFPPPTVSHASLVNLQLDPSSKMKPFLQGVSKAAAAQSRTLPKMLPKRAPWPHVFCQDCVTTRVFDQCERWDKHRAILTVIALTLVPYPHPRYLPLTGKLLGIICTTTWRLRTAAGRERSVSS